MIKSLSKSVIQKATLGLMVASSLMISYPLSASSDKYEDGGGGVLIIEGKEVLIRVKSEYKDIVSEYIRIGRNEGPTARSKTKPTVKAESLPKDMPIFVDGKETVLDDLKLIDPETIKSATIIKGKEGIEIYGEKGKKGVLIIETTNGDTE